MGFRLVPTSMTLNNLEPRNSSFCVFHRTPLASFAGRLCHCSGWR